MGNENSMDAYNKTNNPFPTFAPAAQPRRKTRVEKRKMESLVVAGSVKKTRRHSERPIADNITVVSTYILMLINWLP